MNNGNNTNDTQADARSGSLQGVKVVEFAQVIAGPLAGTLMADMGADVVHVEAPQYGDSARHMGPTKDDQALWWKVLGRNKRSLTLNLRDLESREVVTRLVTWADVVIVTFRSETLARFGLDWETVSSINPSAILLQISGFGANTSKSNAPGFGKMGEARSGVVHLTGFAGEPPVHTGFSHGDATTGLMGAFAVSAALVRRSQDPERRGEWIDLALHETLYRLIEWQVIMYDQLGTIPSRSGNALAVAPGAVINTFLSADGDWITVTSATSRSVENIVRLLGLPVEEFDTVTKQKARREFLDEELRQWISRRSSEEALAALEEADVVASRVFNIEDIFNDPIYRERENIVTVDDKHLGPVRMQSVVPAMRNNPGRVWRTGPDIGEDNELVLGSWLGFSQSEITKYKEDGTV
ncbi:formyl-CoA transferase [Brevibacterium paucivorans]|uniref:Formyl-CoA transferase n=1 Tax=Brevibacterium paucivorans TaxID=170994 RepID=A0ABS2SH66_9MICO|nr:CoA transferase [Brevibacterium paucivorans]MBM7815582.1 formyl-CoA transferase [Brevibacterium paucivorans]